MTFIFEYLNLNEKWINFKINRKLEVTKILHQGKDDFKTQSVDNFGIENYFDENISHFGTGKHDQFLECSLHTSKEEGR